MFQGFATGLEGDDLLVARSVRPSRVAAAARMEMVNTSILGRSTQGAAAIDVNCYIASSLCW